MSTSGKKSWGRKKIDIKKMTNQKHLQVTFLKRRTGIFKKASELSTLSDAEMALIVISPGQKVFSFGHPNVETIIEKYLLEVPTQPANNMQYVNAQSSADVLGLNAKIFLFNNQIDAEKKHIKELDRQIKAVQAQFWGASLIKEMDKSQLEQFKGALDEVKKQVTRYCDMLPMQGDVAASDAPTNPLMYQHFATGPSNAMIPLHHPPPTPPQVFSPLNFQGPMMQTQTLFGGLNNKGGHGGLPPGFY
ncbi:agamous-like MADS-box protein AGL62 [Lotus japonicus]|uniref:agamous-like MADS-box protein AGL62 n=1 Tax=Lotus japonicus TaxID=34305 RepID=UPI002584BC5D|nr:agamous-like MADS-box protein AGL62 [Lotus japonicus]